MPKQINIKSFLPDREIAICQRMREVRLATRMQQAAFAETIGVTRSRLASYEHCKAPIRYEVGKQLCFRHNINQRWFATGEEPNRPYFDLSPNLEFQVAPRALFSEAYEEVLKESIESRAAELEKVVGPEIFKSGKYEEALLDNFHLLGEEDPKAAAFYVARLIRTKLNWLKEPLLTEYTKLLLKADAEFCETRGKEMKSLSEKEDTQKKALPGSSVKGKSKDVSLENLLERVQALTSRPGQKSALAEMLGVSPARVTEWLNRGKEPRGSTTLTLLEWVESEEAKQKISGAATNSTRAQTRKKNGNENKTQSSRKKR